MGNTLQVLENDMLTTLSHQGTNVDQYLLKIRMSENSIFLNPVTYHELDKLIDKLPNKVSSGYDNISNILLKNIKPWIISPPGGNI